MAMLFSTERPLSNGTGAHRPVLARLEDGGFIQVWSFQDGTGNGVGLVRFDGGGNPHEAFVVNSTASFSQDFPAATGLADGGFVVAWTSS